MSVGDELLVLVRNAIQERDALKRKVEELELAKELKSAQLTLLEEQLATKKQENGQLDKNIQKASLKLESCSREENEWEQSEKSLSFSITDLDQRREIHRVDHDRQLKQYEARLSRNACNAIQLTQRYDRQKCMSEIPHLRELSLVCEATANSFEGRLDELNNRLRQLEVEKQTLLATDWISNETKLKTLRLFKNDLRACAIRLASAKAQLANMATEMEDLKEQFKQELSCEQQTFTALAGIRTNSDGETQTKRDLSECLEHCEGNCNSKVLVLSNVNDGTSKREALKIVVSR